MFSVFSADNTLDTKIESMCTDTSSSLGMVTSFLTIRDLLTNNPLLVKFGWKTTAKSTEFVRILAFPNTCRSIADTDSNLIGIAYGNIVLLILLKTNISSQHSKRHLRSIY